MTPNQFLSPYSDNDINALLKSGSISLRHDDSFNLLIDDKQVCMASSSITIPLTKITFLAPKIETKYDVKFKELT